MAMPKAPQKVPEMPGSSTEVFLKATLDSRTRLRELLSHAEGLHQRLSTSRRTMKRRQP
jgi:hypothetical protein